MSHKLGYRRESARCVCAPGNVAHEHHCRPGKTTGAHMDPRCPHSELLNTTQRYAVRRDATEARRKAAAERARARMAERSRRVR